MTMRAVVEGRGQQSAEVVCDSCGAVCRFRSLHEDSKGRHKKEADRRLNVGHAVRKLNSTGWLASATRQTCPTCVAETRDAKPKEATEMVQTPMTQAMAPSHVPGLKPDIPDVPKPSLEQRREIMLMLQEVYDTDAKRYKGEWRMPWASNAGAGFPRSGKASSAPLATKPPTC